MSRMKPERMSEKNKSTRSDTVRSSLRSSNGTSSSSDASPNIASRPKRNVSKRSLDISDFLTSHEEERQLAKALKESLKEVKKGDVTTITKESLKEVKKGDVTTVTKCSSVTSNGTSEPLKESGAKTSEKPQSSQPSSARPKRDAAQRASAITDLLCLKTKEERELRKAIELSRRSNLEEKRRREETPSIVSPSSPVTDLSAAASTSSASVNPRRREEDVKSQVSDASSLDEMILKKPKIPPQRKFAQNSIPGHCPHHSTTCTPVKNAQSFVHRSSVHHVKELFSAITPSTEDFLTFLCFRNAPVLPQKVDLFSMNEKAIQEKSAPNPRLLPSKSTPSKPDGTRLLPSKSTPSKPDGTKVNGSPHGKVLDSRRSSAASSSVLNPFQRSNPPPHRKSNIKLAIKSESSLIHERNPVKKSSLVHERNPVKKSSLVHERNLVKKSSLVHERNLVKKSSLVNERNPVKRKEKSQDRSKERRKKAIMNQATKTKCSSSAASNIKSSSSAVPNVKNSVKSSNEKKSKLDLTPTKRVTRSASSSTAYPGVSVGSTAYSGVSVGSIRVRSVEEEVKAEREKRLKEQMMVIEKEHQVRRRFSSDSSLHSSDSSSSESLPSTSSSASINISRVTRSIETLKQLRVMGQQSKLKSTSINTRRGPLPTAPGGQVASKAILQRAKRNLNSKCSNLNSKCSNINSKCSNINSKCSNINSKCSNGKFTRIPR